MTSTTSAKRRIAMVTSAFAALALVVGLAPTTATATTTATSTTMAAKAKTTKAATAKKKTATNVKAAATVASPTDFTSIFDAQQPALTNAGWTTCPAAITWSVDTAGLATTEAARQIANIQASFDQWATASGLTFQFAGTRSFSYNEAAFTLTPADGTASPSRNINLAFVDDAASSLLGGSTVGMAGPSTVWMTSKEIEGGTGVFRIDAVKKMNDTQARALFTHELGHALGLGHAAEAANIMSPVVGDNATLGAGDIAGIKTMTKPCAA